ncbi:bifunctional coenzyme A disulfide reductase/sulfurtransferase TusA [Hoylesella pleuritidis]|uniref:Sulfurtransferase TusA n=1 Tax=Hoylesella pleuritidis F0068 TaxID=1081904 RepID=U2KK67_9BACT|nr:bifunctional coenzyme A disulfide reductase/sulfurtransferase TusA [Hoylesella pleuritidis]ERJ98881.1 sulfurtransferase TusA [Hoylesella pleuritidis F0068]
MKHIIIGGVAGGATAAARIRRADESAEIVLIEKGKYISYANCGLPYYVGGIIKEREKLFVQTPESFGCRFNIDVRVENEVVGIDTVGKRISVRRIDGTEYTEHYDKLLLSPGSAPMCPPIKGIETEGIFTLRNVEDTDRIKNYLDTHAVRDAVVVGGGFIGLEMAENLHNAGIPVSIIEMAEQVMAPVDFSIASHVHRHLLDKRMSLYLRQGVERFERLNNRIAVYLSSDEKIEADMVLLSIGVRPVTDLAVKAGIDLGERGIKVNAFLETSAPDVYAVGDAIEFTHPLTGKPWLNYLAGPANRQGRIVADNMVFGNQTEYEGAIGTAIAKVFDLVVGTTGLPAKRLKQMGVDYRSSTTVSLSHAGYYPGAFPLTLKLTFSPTDGRLFGAQCVGNDGVDKRIDQIAQIIKQGGTVYDLIKTEQCYAPPFSSAKDPIAIAGYAASNIISGAMPVIDWRKLRDTDRSQVLLLDVRTPAEFELGTIEGAVNIPLDDLRERICEIPRNKKIVIFCAVGLRGYLAQRILMGRGYADVWNLSGGYQIYSLATMPVLNVRRRESSSCPTVPLRTADECRQVIKVDACGLQCPGPIMKLKKAMDNATVGDRVEVQATDAGFPRDAGAWCKSTGNKIVEINADGGYHTVVVEKASSHRREVQTLTDSKNKTLIMFSDDLDRALATFVLANGAAATGHKVSVFFTFWGLNVIKRERKPAVKKDIFGRMFSWMMPSDSRKLRLSQMSMLGLGDRMMRYIMKKKNIDSLEKLRQQALDNGVEFIACQMSMDMMGVQREELIDGVTVGGVATYMERAENANVNLFI